MTILIIFLLSLLGLRLLVIVVKAIWDVIQTIFLD